MNAIVEDTLTWLKASGSKVRSKKELLAIIKDVREWLTEEIDEFEQAVIDDDKSEMLNAVVDATWIVHNLTFHAGLDLNEVNIEGDLVKKSNFSKYCESKEEAEESIDLYSKGLHPNKMGKKIAAIYRKTGDDKYPFAIFRASDNKILKSHKFKDVNVIKNK